MIKIGAVGTSFIMDTILENMQSTEGMHCDALYSRTYEKGKALADKFGISKVYTSFEELCADDTLNWIYIASPNSLHYEQSRQALLAGKNVLCEKPFTVTGAQVRELVSIAKEKHLFLFEAILPMFHPNYSLLREAISQLGELKLANGIFCQYSSRYDALLRGEVPNVFNPQYAGGALMDLNMYNIYFMVGLFGKPEKVEYRAALHSNGIDTNGIVSLTYPHLMVQCMGAKDAFCENGVQILGTEGYIKVSPSPSNCQQVKIVRRGKEDIIYEVTDNPWSYEMTGLVQLVNENNYEECHRRLDIAIDVVDVLEAARKSAGLSF